MSLNVSTTFEGNGTFWEKIESLRVFHNNNTTVDQTNDKPLVIFLQRKKQQLSNKVTKSNESTNHHPKATQTY